MQHIRGTQFRHEISWTRTSDRNGGLVSDPNFLAPRPTSPEAALMVPRSWCSAISCEPASRSRSLNGVTSTPQRRYFMDTAAACISFLILLTPSIVDRRRRGVDPRDNQDCRLTTIEIILAKPSQYLVLFWKLYKMNRYTIVTYTFFVALSWGRARARLSYGRHVRLSVCHTLVLTQNQRS